MYPSKIGELFICECGSPLARRIEIRKFEMLKFHKGRPVSYISEYFPNSDGIAGHFKITCNCGVGHHFVSINETIVTG